MIAAFVIVAASAFTPAEPRPVDGVIIKGSKGSATPIDRGPEAGHRSANALGSAPNTNPADARPQPTPDEQRDLPSRHTTPEDPASPRVISELSEFYAEYAAVQLDRQQKLGQQPITVPEVPAASPGMTPGVQDNPIEQSPAPVDSPTGPPDLQRDDSPEAVATASVPEPTPAAGTGPNEAGTDQPNPTAVVSPREVE